MINENEVAAAILRSLADKILTGDCRSSRSHYYPNSNCISVKVDQNNESLSIDGMMVIYVSDKEVIFPDGHFKISLNPENTING